MIKLKDIVMIHDLKRQGLSIAAIARETGLNPKTVRRHLERGLEAPAYGPRAPRPRLLDPFEGYLSEKVRTCPGLSGRRLFREIAALGHEGGYTAVTGGFAGAQRAGEPVKLLRIEMAETDLHARSMHETDHQNKCGPLKAPQPGPFPAIQILPFGHCQHLWRHRRRDAFGTAHDR